VTEEPVIDYLDHAPTSPIFTYTDDRIRGGRKGC
jgi:hypothetical protein